MLRGEGGRVVVGIDSDRKVKRVRVQGDQLIMQWTVEVSWKVSDT